MLILDKGPTQGLDGTTLTAEVNFFSVYFNCIDNNNFQISINI